MIRTGYLRPNKAEAIRKNQNNGFYLKDIAVSHKYQNAYIIPVQKFSSDNLQFGRGGVVSETGEYIKCSGIENRIYDKYEFTDPLFIDEKVAFCGYMVNQWGHFLIETVPRLWICLSNDETIDKYVFILENKSQRKIGGNYIEFLKLMGIEDKCVFINCPTQYREVVVPELSYSRNRYYTKQYTDIFQFVIENALKNSSSIPTSKNIFLSRNHFRKARHSEFGLDLLDNFFLKNDFNIVYPEEISLTEMICLIQNADVCAASSGTAPHNFLFAQQGKRVLILERQATVNEIQVNLDIIKQFDVTYVDSHYSLYPVSAGGGPFFFAYTKWFRQFVNDYSYVEPDNRYICEKYNRDNLRLFLKTYFDWYGYSTGMESWMLMYSDLYYEAHTEARMDLGKWLLRAEPLFKTDILSFRYFKSQIKKMLK